MGPGDGVSWLSWLLDGPQGNLIAMAIGGLTAWAGGRRASQELREEAQRLRRMMNTIARGLEEADIGRFTWSESGELRGVSFLRFMEGQITPSGKVSLTGLRGQPAQDDQRGNQG
jgi:hypothetical protein